MTNIQITNLPKDVLVEMVKYLTIKERHNVLGKVNKFFHSVVQQFVIGDKRKELISKYYITIKQSYLEDLEKTDDCKIS